MKACLAIACVLVAQPFSELQFRTVDKHAVEVVARLTPVEQDAIPLGPLSYEQGEKFLRLCVVDPQTNKLGPAMFGEYRHEKVDELIFRPRFGLEPGRTYRAIYLDNKTKDYHVPPRLGGAQASIVKIFPTADVLPANHLKFYVYFSQPMRGGKEIFNQIQILDADGNVVSDPWLTDELWDETGTVLIIYIHPGRIKWGLVLREVLGPVLEPNKDYSFVVRGAMLDADGRPLGKDVVKKFRTTAEDRVRIDLNECKVRRDGNGVTASFPKSLDHKSLEKLLSVVDDKGKTVSGKFAIGKDEKSWSFTPATPLGDREYRLKFDGKLEDVAGNTPLRPFDVDLRAPQPPEQRLELPIPR